MPYRPEFYCNDLRVAGKKIIVRRAPFGQPDYRCGKILHKYKKKNWAFELTTETCSSGKAIYKMKSTR